MVKSLKGLFLGYLVFVSFLVFTNSALAQVCTDFGGGYWECVGGPYAGNQCDPNNGNGDCLAGGGGGGVNVPTGRAIDLHEIILLSQDVAGFLMIAGGILAGIIIILSGYKYLTAGSDSTKIKSAKDMLKAGMIGSLIIFGFGLIIRTIESFASNPFQFFP